MNKFNIKQQQIISDQPPGMDKNSIIYDPSSVPSTGNLPNVEKILDEIIKILECMNTDEMKLLKESNKPLFDQVMEEKFPEFSGKYFGIFQMVLTGEDLSPLFKMLNIITNITEGGTSFEDGEKDVGTYLTKFLPTGLLDKIQSGEITPDMIKQKPKNKKNKK